MAADREEQVRAQAWTHALSFINSKALLAAAELGIPDIMENHGSPMSLSDLSAASGCPPELLYRLMRLLIFHGIFQKTNYASSPSAVHYAQTSLSRVFMTGKLGTYVTMLGSPQGKSLIGESIRNGRPSFLSSFNGEDLWSDPDYGFHDTAFTNAMTAHARFTAAAIIKDYPSVFDGIQSVVDVGGRHGVALGDLVEAFPWVRGITLDLPEIVADAPPRKGIEFVGGNMFGSVPIADAVMLMWILHDWSDKACIEILKKCKEAVPAKTGKVMIVETIIDEDGEGSEFAGARLSLDLIMMVSTVQGKERTYKEWVHLLNEAGFSSHSVKNIKTLEFVIEAYP